MPEEPTTPDPAALVPRAVDAVNARDIDAILSLGAPDGIHDLSHVGLGIFEGHAAIRRFFEEYWATFEDYELELEETRDLGGGVNFAVLRQSGRLPGSAAQVELRYANVTTWTDGLVERTTAYLDVDDARAAAERLAERRGDV